MINSKHSKLFQLRKWLTLAEASKHLTNICGEEVTVADILLLALDKHLTLSANFVNHAYAKAGKVIHYDEEKLINSIKQGIYPTEFKFSETPFSNEMLMLNLRLDKGKFLSTEDKIVTIEGVWDLPMIGGEEIYVKEKYHELTDGASIDLVNIDGSFVARNDDIICSLQESFDDYSNDYYGYKAQWQTQFDKYKRLQSNKTTNHRKEKILRLRKEKSKKFYDILDEWNRLGKYFPAGNLPEDTILVVRTDALREFEQRISEENVDTSNKLDRTVFSETERNTMLKLIIGMAIDAYGYNPDNKRNSATGDNKNSISASLQKQDISISDDTIRKYLNEAKNLL